MRLYLGIAAEDWSVRRLLVKQSYPLKTSGEQSCESARRSAMEEASRIITSDGTVIRTLVDGSTQVIDWRIAMKIMFANRVPVVATPI